MSASNPPASKSSTSRGGQSHNNTRTQYPPTANLEELLDANSEESLNAEEYTPQQQTFQTQGAIIEELSDTSSNSSWTSDFDPPPHHMTMTTSIDNLFTTPPLLRDMLQTSTSILQEETVSEVLPFLACDPSTDLPSPNQHGVPPLLRKAHIAFLHKALGTLPAPYMAADAGRPWFFYWALCGLCSLGEDVTVYRKRLASTVAACQHPDGGFGGGHGQMAHLAPSYAILLALAMVGGEVAFEVVDREKMWRWLGRCKSVDGGFCMSVGGEEDVRGVYCAVVLISLLNLPVELPDEEKERFEPGADLLTGLAEWVSRCQTFEGGISSRPDAEAHGAYAFCALACLCILGPPHITIPRYLNVPLLISWLSARQYAPEGGFAGRTNKLVDGCYSHWIGGCWPIIDGVLQNLHRSKSGNARNMARQNLYSREGLIRYILCCCQETSKRGGLRDKPSKFSDAYHTCYVLAGLSGAQHSWDYTPSKTNALEPFDQGNEITAPYHWRPATENASYESEPTGTQVFDEGDRVEMLHPVFVVPVGRAEAMREYFVSKKGIV